MTITDRIRQAFRSADSRIRFGAGRDAREAKGVEQQRPLLPTGAHGGHGWFSSLFARRLPGTNYDYLSLAGDVTLNSAVGATLRWIQLMFVEARPSVWRRAADGTMTEIPGHPLTLLLNNPNPYYGGDTLFHMLLRDLIAGTRRLEEGGNAYLHKTRAGMSPRSPVAELWYLPSATIVPAGAAGTMVERFEYRPPTGGGMDYLPSDIVHFRWGMDPDDLRKGRSPLYAAVREICADNEASTYAASILRNGGVPPVILSPKDASFAPLSDEERIAAKQQFKELTTGDRRGEPLMPPAALDVHQLAFDPKSMDLSTVRKTPEERIAAVMGVPPGVIGLGAGLDRNTYSNYKEAIQAAMDFCVIPLQKFIARELTRQLLLPDFGADADMCVHFDVSQMPSMQDDRSEEADRMKTLTEALEKLVAAGADPNEAAIALGLPEMTFTEPEPEPKAGSEGGSSGGGGGANPAKSASRFRYSTYP